MNFETFRNQVAPLIAIAGALGGIVATILWKVVDRVLNDGFEERKRALRHEIEMARKVFDICNEASTNNFKNLPQDMKHVNSILSNLEGIDENMCKNMEEFISSWGTFARERTRKGLLPDDVRFLKEQLDRAEERRKILINWANKIKVGKKYIFW